MTSALTDLLEHHIQARHCPGALVHVERAGQVLARHALGRIRPDDDAAMHFDVRFRIASLTKPVVTVAALMLVDEGKLDLDAAVSDHLPVMHNLRMQATGSKHRPATVRDLMRHTSGLAYPFEINDAALRQAWLQAGITPAMSGLDSAALLARLAALPLVAAPGTVFRYGYSTDVLGCIVEQLDGLPLAQSLQRRIFAPLGMQRTGFELAADEQPHLAVAYAEDTAWHAAIPAIGRRQPGQPWMDSGGGGLISTLDDYAAFARMLAHGGVVQGDVTQGGAVQGGAQQGQRLLSEALFAQATRNQLPEGADGPNGYCGSGFGFGLGWAVRHDWGPAAMPCSAGELTWSGISGTALFVQPREQWFAVMFSANMASRMMARMGLRRALNQI